MRSAASRGPPCSSAGDYLFGTQAAELGGGVSVLLLAAAVARIIAALVLFRRHEAELDRRAELAPAGPLRVAPR
jgi:hypothetical protein